MSCDEGYGRSVDFLDGVAAPGLGNMAEVPVDTRVWPERPPTVVPRTRPRWAPGAPPSLKVRALAAQLPADAWTRHRVPGDSRGPEYADFAIRWVVASRGSLPGPDVWLVLRRQPGADPVRVFLCHAPRRAWHTDRRAGPSRPTSGKASSCWVWATTRRSWQGWHRHTTLCLLLHFFLLQGKRALKKNSPASSASTSWYSVRPGWP